MSTSSKLHRKQLTVAEAKKKQLFSDESNVEPANSILDDLVPTDVVALAEYEDELSRLEDTCFVRAVPSPHFEKVIPPRFVIYLRLIFRN